MMPRADNGARTQLNSGAPTEGIEVLLTSSRGLYAALMGKPTAMCPHLNHAV